jgi:intracellular sulfur oxidation DsrE/DsrF family protein
MKIKRFFLALALLSATLSAFAEGKIVQTPYKEPKVVFEFFLDHPAKIDAAVSWLRTFFNPLTDPPYEMSPEDMSVKVVLHGTELVAVAKKNYEKYKDAVERMRYYASLGVDFKVCGLAAQDFGYRPEDFQDFIQIVPSAITELAHWQNRGYALIVPQVKEKVISTEAIR